MPVKLQLTAAFFATLAIKGARKAKNLWKTADFRAFSCLLLFTKHFFSA